MWREGEFVKELSAQCTLFLRQRSKLSFVTCCEGTTSGSLTLALELPRKRATVQLLSCLQKFGGISGYNATT
eukprot:5922714-Pleurochrysis_carterae.AAC.1